ncbi:MAG: phospholipase, partial [Ramlibacter sp.]|nr:phospholipase [Ramlibacter sp.]
GITDYHLHLNYNAAMSEGLVLYPHFQRSVVPGWLDKGLKWRHGATHFLDNTIVLAPDPEWVKHLPNGKLPDRTDFTRYGVDLASRVKAWTAGASASRQLADEFGEWLQKPDASRVEAL